MNLDLAVTLYVGNEDRNPTRTRDYRSPETQSDDVKAIRSLGLLYALPWLLFFFLTAFNGSVHLLLDKFDCADCFGKRLKKGGTGFPFDAPSPLANPWHHAILYPWPCTFGPQSAQN